MNTQLLIDQINANPRDTNLKLIYADFLEQSGQVDLAEAWRLMVQEEAKFPEQLPFLVEIVGTPDRGWNWAGEETWMNEALSIAGVGDDWPEPPYETPFYAMCLYCDLWLKFAAACPDARRRLWSERGK